MGNLIRSEWLKLRSVRSTAWTLPAVFVIGVGLSYIVGRSFRSGFSNMPREQQETFDPLFATFYSLTLAQLAVVVFAVVAVGSEYSTGTIRVSLTATPQRGRFYAAKVLAAALPVLVVSLMTALTTFFVAQVGLGPLGTAIAADGSAAALAGAWLYLTMISVFAMGVTAIVRSSKRSLIVMLPVFFLGAQGIGNLAQIRDVVQYLPDQAGMVMMHVVGPDGDPQFGRDYGPPAALGILAVWTVAALAGGALVTHRREV